MQLNFDVWQEIISYLWFPEDLPTLRSLALTSKIPSNLALDAIWEGGQSFLKIESVINSFSASPDTPFLEFQSDTVRGDFQWVLHRPLPYATRQRAIGYLTRIRKLSVLQTRPRKEELLFPLLPTWLEHPGPLFPNLRRLNIADVTQDVRAVRIDRIAPVISPSLNILEIYAGGSAPEQSLLLPILELMRARGCDLKFIAYSGIPVRRAPEVLASFKSLQNVYFSQLSPLQSSITVVKFLASLPSLRSLNCDTGVFMHRKEGETFCHTSLQTMRITCQFAPPWEPFRQCLFPSITEVKIEAGNCPGLGAPNSSCLAFEGLGTSCPNVQKLRLTVHPNFRRDSGPMFDFRQLTPLLPSSTMEEFDLRVPELELTPADFRVISESWPNLRSFSIHPATALEFTALSSLAAFSKKPHLIYLNLNIRPHYLLNNIAEVPDLIAAHTPIQDVRSEPCAVYFDALHSPPEIPIVTRSEKRLLVEYLLLVFPGLKLELTESHLYGAGDSNPDGEMLVELQDILLEVRRGMGSFEIIYKGGN